MSLTAKKTFILSSLFLVMAILPSFALINAQAPANDPSLCEREPNNPACSPGSNVIVDFLNKIIDFLISIGAAVGMLFLVIAAFFFLTARGDNNKLERARAMVLWVIIGLAVVLMAKFFIGLVASYVKT